MRKYTFVLCIILTGLMVGTGRAAAAEATPESETNAGDKGCSMETASAVARSLPTTGSPFARFRHEGIRAVSRANPGEAAAAGFNVVLPWGTLLEDARKTTPPDSPILVRAEDFSKETVRELREAAIECKQNDLVMMRMIYVAGGPTVRQLSGIDGHIAGYLRNQADMARKVWPAHQYRRLVDWNGGAALWAPCPLERRYWMGLIRPELELVARVLKETGASGGGALELETYCFPSIYPGMASQKKTFCFCDHCYYGFVRSLNGSDAPEAVRSECRFDWLTQRGLLMRYERCLEDRLAGLIEEMIGEVRKINPEFLFGMYPYAPFWYYDALIRGSGTPELPCLLFPSVEYSGGYAAGVVPPTYFGDAPTPASIAHLRRRQLPTLYAGGLWAKDMASPDAVAMAMDRLLRGPDGFWVYESNKIPEHEQLLRQAAKMKRWTTANPGPLAAGDVKVDSLPTAIARLTDNRPEGITTTDGRIVMQYEGRDNEIRLEGGDFEDEIQVASNWSGRGILPMLDRAVYHSGNSSMRFAPSTASEGPRSPYIDRKIPAGEAVPRGRYELSCWVRASGEEPVRCWVGQADSDQYPAYMRYQNYALPAGNAWKHLRVGIRYKGSPPLVLRFWCPPTAGKLWLDDVTLRPVQPRTISIPLIPPADAATWGTVHWLLSPGDARYKATLLDAEDRHPLRMRLYSGDNVAPLEAVVGMRPVVLRLEVYPSMGEPVELEKVQVNFVSK